MRSDKKTGKQYFRKECKECENKGTRKIENEPKPRTPANYTKEKLTASVIDLVTNGIVKSLKGCLDYFAGHYHDVPQQAPRLKDVTKIYEKVKGYTLLRLKASGDVLMVRGTQYKRSHLHKAAKAMNVTPSGCEFVFESLTVDWDLYGIEWTPEELADLNTIEDE